MTDLAKSAQVSVSTLKRVEDGANAAGSSATVALIQSALEAAGVDFLCDEGEGPGLRLRPRRASPFSRFF